jgi:hypothetical protein
VQQHCQSTHVALSERLRAVCSGLVGRIQQLAGESPAHGGGRGQRTGGEAGIRTLGRGLSPYNGLANRRLQPLGHLTMSKLLRNWRIFLQLFSC